MFQFAQFRFLYPYLWQEKRAYLIGATLTLVSTFFLVVNPRLIGEAIHILDEGSRPSRVPALAMAMVGAVLLRGLTAFYMRRITIGASRRIEYRFRNRLFRHIEAQDARFFSSIHTGDLISRFTSDVDAVRAAIGPGVMYSINTFFTLTFALIWMGMVSISLTIYSMIPLILLTFVIRTLGPKVHRESMAAQQRLSEVSTQALENFSHIKVLKAYVRESAEIKRMQLHSDAYFEQNMRMIRLRAWTNALLFLFGDLVVLSLLSLGGMEIIRGEIALGDFAAFKGCQLILIWPMIALGWVMMLFQRGAASAKRLRELLDARPEIDDTRAMADAKVANGGLRFDRMSFSFDKDDKRVLDDIRVELRAGETLGVVGPTGCGKTTLLHLIARLQPVTAGELLVDGRPIHEYSLVELRDAIGYVPQEPFLFSATIRENIAFGVDDVSDERVEEVARLVAIHDEIMGFPHGYQQRVGERGITLSGGQKQRIALARALLKEPRLLLLDDVLSAVDASTETAILAGLKRWTKGLSTVIVSHRLSSVRHAQQIIVLDEGRITQRGTHEQLLQQEGFYADLYQKQTLEAELEDL
ncbi:MAG: ABC transporter ATP-binding protein [Planctomycetota bacterium]